MADFCDVCAPKMGFAPDFKIEDIFQGVEEGYYKAVLCEGCALGGIGKENGELLLCAVGGSRWQTKEDYFKVGGGV